MAEIGFSEWRVGKLGPTDRRTDRQTGVRTGFWHWGCWIAVFWGCGTSSPYPKSRMYPLICIVLVYPYISPIALVKVPA